jgi:hypothetical protein
MTEPIQRMRLGLAIRPGPEEKILISETGSDATARDEAPIQNDILADHGTVPDDTGVDSRSSADDNPAQNARAGVECSRRGPRQHAMGRVEQPSAGREGPTASERFERRAEEIARAAEVGEHSFVQGPTDLVAPREHRLPEIGDEGSLAGRNALQKSAREDADAGISERPRHLFSEAYDAIPFGLKRRVPMRVPVFDDEQRSETAAAAVTLQKTREVGLDGRVTVDDEDVARRKPGCGVLESPGGAEDLMLSESDDLDRIRRAFLEVAENLLAEMMQIDAHLAKALAPKACEVSVQKGDVQERKKRLRNPLGHRTKAKAPSGREQEGLRHRRRTRSAELTAGLPENR